MVLEAGCYRKLRPAINGFFQRVADSRPPMDWVVVRAGPKRGIDGFVGNQVDPALDWFAILVFIPVNHISYDKKNSPTFKNPP